VGVSRIVDVHHVVVVEALVEKNVNEAGVLVREAVMVLAPDVAGEQHVDSGDGLAPGDVTHGCLKPLAVLVDHRVDEVDEALVARPEAMPAGEDIALEKPLALMLGELLDDVAYGREVFVVRGVIVDATAEPLLVRDLVAGLQTIGGRLVGPEDAKHVAVAVDELGGVLAQDARGLGGTKAVTLVLDVDLVRADVRQHEVLEEQTTVGIGVATKAKLSLRHELGDLRTDGAAAVKQLLGLVRREPALEHLEVGLGVARGGEGHLVRTPAALGLLAVDLLGAGPALGRAEDDHRVERARRIAGGRTLLDRTYLVEDRLEKRGKATMDGEVVLVIETGDEVVRVVAHATEELVALAVGDARKNRGVGDLVAIEVQDGQDDAIGERIHELVGLPGRGERARLGLTISHHGNGEQRRVVENRTVGMGENVAELPTLMDRAGGLGRVVAGNAARIGELAEELLEAFLVVGDLRLDLTIGAVKQRLRGTGRSTMARAHEEHGVLIVVVDETVDVTKEEVHARRGSPVTYEAILDVLAREVTVHERVGTQVDLSYGEIVCRAPVPVDPSNLLLADRLVELLPGGADDWLCHVLLLRWDATYVAIENSIQGKTFYPAQDMVTRHDFCYELHDCSVVMAHEALGNRPMPSPPISASAKRSCACASKTGARA